MFSDIYLFVIWNDYEISGGTVFHSFMLKNLILIIRYNGKLNFDLFNRINLHFIYLVAQNLKLDFIGKKVWKNALDLKSKIWSAKRYKVYSGKRLSWHYRLQHPFFYKNESRTSFNFFRSGDQRLMPKQLMPSDTTIKWQFNDMVLFSHWLLWLKNWHFSINSCKDL